MSRGWRQSILALVGGATLAGGCGCEKPPPPTAPPIASPVVGMPLPGHLSPPPH